MKLTVYFKNLTIKTRLEEELEKSGGQIEKKKEVFDIDEWDGIKEVIDYVVIPKTQWALVVVAPGKM